MKSKEWQVKTAKRAGSAAIWVSCPECGGDCEGSEGGSLMITDQDETVFCVDCHQTFNPPKLDRSRKTSSYRKSA